MNTLVMDFICAVALDDAKRMARHTPHTVTAALLAGFVEGYPFKLTEKGVDAITHPHLYEERPCMFPGCTSTATKVRGVSIDVCDRHS